ncbi:MAG: CDP-paratose 2-epimerase [Fimbriimonadaceae bacterium]|nr:CDP-paratose 2-epimerase [Fimbriimonadaceae bacterium]
MKRPALITGGAGFIGTNLAHRLLSSGRPVIVLDNLSRHGVDQNAAWLRDTHGERARITFGDVRDPASLRDSVGQAEMVFHFAAQVAVTTSLEDPITDFDINARGTLNVLEEIRRLQVRPPMLFTSTNKVYGGLEDVWLEETRGRYEPVDMITRMRGIGEDRCLDFHSPYGCSKGTADQYVIDYSRTMGTQGVVFRMSCIYGPHQFGNEDQGWVAHFLIQAMKGRPIRIYGDGKQVRDVLFAEDLVDAFILAMEGMNRLSGQAFNMGGGPENTISLLELLNMIEQLLGARPEVSFSDWRPGDQRYYVSDFGKFSAATGWTPRRSPEEGVRELYRWLAENHVEVKSMLSSKAGAF